MQSAIIGRKKVGPVKNRIFAKISIFWIFNCLNMDKYCPFLDNIEKIGQHNVKCEACQISCPNSKKKCLLKKFVRGGEKGPFFPPPLQTPNRDFIQSVLARRTLWS